MGGHLDKVKEHVDELFHVRENIDRFHTGASDLLNRSALYAEVGALTKEDLVFSVNELNKILKTHANSTEEKVYFAIKPGSSSSFIWKGIIKIVCYKISTSNKTVDITRELSLPSYWALRHGLYQQLVVKALGKQDASSGNPQVQMESCVTSSSILARIRQMESVDDNECCICMETCVEVSLTCAHGFCKECIKEWRVDHSSCPTCRGVIESRDEFWEMPSIPLNSEIDQQIVMNVSKS